MIPNYDAIIKKAKALCDNKNTDYAQIKEPFSNFEMVEALKICDTSTGILVRISDKSQFHMKRKRADEDSYFKCLRSNHEHERTV